MAQSITPLANITLSATQATVTFSSISSAYRDLMLVMVPIATGSVPVLNIAINSDAGANYSAVNMVGNGTSATSSTTTLSAFQPSYGVAVNTAADTVIRCDFLDAFATDKHKAILVRHQSVAYGVAASAHRWASTSAITSLTLSTNPGSFAAGSTFALYGVSA